MIIIIGSVTIRDETIDEALRISQEHVNRSRIEAGCISCLLYTSPSPRDKRQSRMPSSA